MSEPPKEPQAPLLSGPTVSERPARPRREIRGGTPITQFRTGAVLGKYRVVQHLGAGGMGAVYEAQHTEIGKAVAIKVLSTALATDPRALARFLREAAAASRLQHRNVVNVTDYGSDEGVPFIVMELLRGEDLGAHLDRHPRGMDVSDAVDILIAVCIGVFAAHESGVTHRDLKPRNIFLARTELREIEPKVLDFGISRIDDDTLAMASITDSDTIVGTLPYLSPEHVTGQPTDARSDQYSLGVVLYECLTGRYAHEGTSRYALMRNIAEGRFFPPSARRPSLDKRIEDIVLRAMALNPADRFESVLALAKTLLPFASPRKRLLWAEYFRHVPDEGAAPDDAVGVISHAGEPVAPRLGSEAKGGAAAIVATSPPLPDETPRRSWVRPVLWLAIVGMVGVAALAVGPRLTEAPAPTRSAPPPVSTPPPAPPAMPQEPRPREVTINVTGLPSDARAFVDGDPVSLPLRLKSNGRSHSLRFEAPGHASATVDVVPVEDRDLKVAMRRLPQRSPKRKPKRSASEQQHRGAAPDKPASAGPSSPPPILDI